MFPRKFENFPEHLFFRKRLLKYFWITLWKLSKYGVISGPYFPLFRKIRTRNNPVFGHFSLSECSSNFICYLGSSHNFKKQTYSTIDSLKTPYDYLSIMHYSKTAFGSGKVTIITKDRTMQEKIGQRDRMSDIDAIQLNRLYKCGIWYNFFNPDLFSQKTSTRVDTCFYYSVLLV